MTATSRNLSIDQIDGPPVYNVGYDPETNIVTTSDTDQDLPAEIWVTATGDAYEVSLNGRTIPGEDLMAIDERVEEKLGHTLPKDPTVCDQIGRLQAVGDEAEVQTDETDADEPQPEAE